MIDEDIIAAAKRIILKNSKKEEKIELDSKSEDPYKTQRKIELLFNIIQEQEKNLRRIEQEQDKNLRRIEQKLDMLAASK